MQTKCAILGTAISIIQKEGGTGLMSKQQLKERGFTIIEVVLVLAIAALIFLMVFIALPALQASQRDTARKSDVSIVSAAYDSASGNNNGNSVTTAILRSYVNNLSDNSNKDNVKVQGFTNSVSPADADILVVTSAKCGESSSSSQQLTSGTRRQFATITKLEGGGGAYYCLNS